MISVAELCLTDLLKDTKCLISLAVEVMKHCILPDFEHLTKLSNYGSPSHKSFFRKGKAHRSHELSSKDALLSLSG